MVDPSDAVSLEDTSLERDSHTKSRWLSALSFVVMNSAAIATM